MSCAGGSPLIEERSISASALAPPIGAESFSFGFKMDATLPVRPVSVFDFNVTSRLYRMSASGESEARQKLI